MVEATQNPTQPQASAVDEALKRNTDCVYFLASPLTCKKGGECEYRHSEYARVNPRDCYYWLNGNCLNPKCGFRHPPLDALLGTQAAAASGSSVPPSQTAAAPITHVLYNSGKQGVACIFFQKGQCVKGDRCTFFHGPNHFGNKPSQLPTVANAIPANEPPSLKKTFGGLQKCTTEERRVPPSNVSKVVEVKIAPKIETVPSRNAVAVGRNIPVINEEAPYYNREPIVSSIGNGNNVTRSNRVHQIDASDDIGMQNVYDADEFLRETSPGFDVLVDDELRESDYYQGEDQYGRTRGGEERNLNSVDVYNSSVGDADRGVFRDARGYDSYEQYDQIEGQYGWEQHRASSDRASHLEKRGYPKSERHDHVQESDLRYHLSKQKGTNGLRSVVSHDNRSEERNYQAPYRRDSQCHETSLVGRLRGRIKLPEREMGSGRTRSRFSPGRPPIPSHQGRLCDRIKGRVEENYNNEGRNFGGPPRMLRREITDERRTDFAPPKSLAELKAKNVDSENNNYSIRKRKSLDDPLPSSEGEFPFEGPKPLSEILKRKRRSEPSTSILSNEDKYNKGTSETLEKADIQTSEQGTGTETEQTMEVQVHELEGDDQQEGEYEYEQGDEGEYYEEGTYEEGNYEEGAEEYVEDEEEGEDLSKKIGVMLS